MIKDIWHFPSEAPAYCFLCVFENNFDGEVHCGHYNPVKKQFCSTEGRYEINQVKRYCDLLHLLDCEKELIRTRKALEIAKDALDAGRTLARIAGFEMLATGMDEAVKQITALEQKDVK